VIRNTGEVLTVRRLMGKQQALIPASFDGAFRGESWARLWAETYRPIFSITGGYILGIPYSMRLAAAFSSFYPAGIRFGYVEG
jgi:hypothetical protein